MSVELCRNRQRESLPFTRWAGRGKAMLLMACVAPLCLCGCGPRRVRADFKNYEAAYAQTSNHQLLLNLARLKNHDPAYFFKLGQITSSYRMQGNITGTGQLTSSSGAVQIPNGGGTPGLIYENDPTFQFIPVNDDTNARLLLEPIQAETFDALYQQGWRLDQLFRLLVDRIEITRPVGVMRNGKPGMDCEIETLRNLPPPTATPTTPEDRDALSNYVTFLRVSALVYELQREGHLVLGGTQTFRPYDKDSLIPLSSGESGNAGDREGNGGGESDNKGDGKGAKGGGDAPQAKDLEAAVEKNNIWKRTPQGWELGHNIFMPVFYLTPMIPVTTIQDGQTVTTYAADIAQIIPDIHLTELSSGTALQNAMLVLANGFSIQSQESQQEVQQDVCPAPTVASLPSADIATSGASAAPPQVKMSAKLILRSLMAVMAAASQEEATFDDLRKSIQPIPPSQYDSDAEKSEPPETFVQAVPPIEQIPLLQLQWTDRGDLKDPLVALNYHGKDYLVSDPKNPILLDNQYWNRDMFRLINALTSQVTVDISKFPLPEILQLHSD
jgi:hypothetical protein